MSWAGFLMSSRFMTSRRMPVNETNIIATALHICNCIVIYCKQKYSDICWMTVVKTFARKSQSLLTLWHVKVNQPVRPVWVFKTHLICLKNKMFDGEVCTCFMTLTCSLCARKRFVTCSSKISQRDFNNIDDCMSWEMFDFTVISVTGFCCVCWNIIILIHGTTLRVQTIGCTLSSRMVW